MPVHRVAAMDGVVYAFTGEIDAWRSRSAALIGEMPEEPSSELDDRREPEIQPAAGEVAIPADKPRLKLRYSVPMMVAVLLVVGGLGTVATLLRAAPPLEIVLASDNIRVQGGSFTFRAEGGGEEYPQAYRILRDPRGDEHQLTPPVTRNNLGAFVWVFSTDCQTVPGRYEIWLGKSSGHPLTPAAIVTVQENPQCSGPVPDLLVESVTVDSPRVEAGATLRFQFVLRNQGKGTANPSITTLRLTQSPVRSSISDLRLLNVAAGALAPGQSSQFDATVALPPTLAPGVYYVWAVADNGSDNIEAYTHNNYVRSTAVTVTAARANSTR